MPKKRTYLWQYSRPGGAVVFDFRMGREREGFKRFLGDIEGILQSDGYAAYDHVGGPKIVHAACWAHARRTFFQVVELNPQDRTVLVQISKKVGVRTRGALGERESLACQIGPKFKLCTRTVLKTGTEETAECARASGVS